MANKRLKKTILQVVSNQLKDPATVYVKETYDKMRDMGYTSVESKEAIAAVLKRCWRITVSADRQNLGWG